MRNAEIADAFAELADRLALTDLKPFRYLAYRTADTTFRELAESVEVLSREGRLRELDGVGEAIAEKVEQLLATGTFDALERAREDVSDTLLALTRLPGIGPATAKKVFSATDEATFDELLARAAAGTLAIGGGVTRKVVGALADEAARRASGGSDELAGSQSGVPLDATGKPLPGPWFRRDQALAQAVLLVELLADAGLDGAEIGGAYARGCEVVSGLELLATSTTPDAALASLVGILVDRGFEHGSGGEFVTPAGVPVSITIVEPAERETARSAVIGPAGWARVHHEPGADEVPVELRERVLAGAFTVESAPRDLIEATDLNGDLHGHSDWSDGRATIIEMAHAARERGDSWYLVSDHSAPYAMVGGLDEQRLIEQAQEIARANEQLQHEHEHDGAPAFRLLHGSEVEVLADGSLGLPDSALARLDWVVASIHVAQRQSADAVLERMRRVIANPLVDAIGHPTSRRLLRRERTALDVDALIDLAAGADVVLEINANPDRLDLDSGHAAQALAAGVRLTINTDAHRPEHLDLRSHGVAVARRAGVRARDVVNCLPIDRLLATRRRDR